MRSLIGLMPLLTVETIEPALLDALPGFKQRLEWYLVNQPAPLQPHFTLAEARGRRTPAYRLTHNHRMKCLLRRMLAR